MKLIYWDRPVPVPGVKVEGGVVHYAVRGFWRTPIGPQRCSYLIAQKGVTANGRRRPGRMCKNDAVYATYTGEAEDIHKWVDPLCTQHHKKRAP